MKLSVIAARADGTLEQVDFSWRYCVAVGYAGRDQASVNAHVEELRAIGVPAPSTVPSMYWVDPARMSADTELSVVGGGCSGEVEFFAAYDDAGRMYFTIASDHTDRHLETVSVSKAKQACSKIFGNLFWAYDDVKNHWDEIQLRAWVTEPGQAERLYQDGKLGDLLVPEKLFQLAKEDLAALGGQGTFSFFSGTIPLKSAISYKGSFRMELFDPVLKRGIQHGYNVIELPDRN